MIERFPSANDSNPIWKYAKIIAYMINNHNGIEVDYANLLNSVNFDIDAYGLFLRQGIL